MKKSKLLLIIPAMFALSSCTFEGAVARAKSLVKNDIPTFFSQTIPNWFDGIFHPGKKDEEKTQEKTLVSLGKVTAPAEIAVGAKLLPSQVKVVLNYSDGSSEEVAPESVTLDTSEAGTKQGSVSYKGQTATFTIEVKSTVINVTGVSLDQHAMTLTAGGVTGTLTATVAPATATDTVVSWSSSDQAVATVANGVVTPVAAGDAVITVTTHDGSKTDTCNVHVDPAEKTLLSIAVTTNPTKMTYEVGDTFDPTGMVVTATYGNGYAAEEVTNYTYKTTALEKSDATFTISYNGKDTTITLTINDKAVEKGTADNPYTASEILEAFKDLPEYVDSTSTDCWGPNRVYVTGTVKEYGTSNKYVITDGSSDFIVYKSATPTGFVRACVGDTATFEGFVENYNGTLEMTSYTDGTHDALPTTVAVLSRGTSTISLKEGSSANAVVTFAPSATNASDYSFTVVANSGHNIASVKVNDAVVTGENGTYSIKILGNTEIYVETVPEGQKVPVTVTKTITELVSENDWGVSAGSTINGCYTSFNLDSVVLVEPTGDPNCGSIWGTDPNYEMRLYQNKGGKLKFSVPSDYTINSVKITFAISNTGQLSYEGGVAVSNTAIDVNDSAIEFTVTNSKTATNGQVKLKAFEIVYVQK